VTRKKRQASKREKTLTEKLKMSDKEKKKAREVKDQPSHIKVKQNRELEDFPWNLWGATESDLEFQILNYFIKFCRVM
jgi:hypothetical protein